MGTFPTYPSTSLHRERASSKDWHVGNVPHGNALIPNVSVAYNADMKRWVRRILIAVLALVVAFVGISWMSAQRLTGADSSSVGKPPSDFPYPIKSIALMMCDDHTIAGWLVPAETRDKAVVLLHGYGGSRKQMLPCAKSLASLATPPCVYDARACGESSGDRITFGYRDART